MKDVGSVDYEIHRVEGLTREISADCIAIEEPLEIIVRYYKGNDWVIEPLMVTMRTPGDDSNLVSGLLFSEGVIEDKSAIDSIKVNAKNKGKYDVDNSLIVTLSKGNQLDLKNLQRHFMVNSSCGVCGKGTLNAIEIAYEPEINKEGPIVSIGLISKLPIILSDKQKQFASTGGVHASALLSDKGEVLHIAEDGANKGMAFVNADDDPKNALWLHTLFKVHVLATADGTRYLRSPELGFDRLDSLQAKHVSRKIMFCPQDGTLKDIKIECAVFEHGFDGGHPTILL